MEMASSAISDLRPFVRRRDLLPDVNGGLGRSQFSRYGPLDLASPDRFWIFCLCCRGEDYPRSFCPGCYVLDNGDSYSRLSIDDDKASRLLFLIYWCWYSCRCCMTALMVACVHAALALRLKKLCESFRQYLQVHGSLSIFGCLQKSTRLCSGRRTKLKTSKICYYLLDFIL